ncbi:hypothetical protein V5785_00485 [Bacillus subtilis]
MAGAVIGGLVAGGIGALVGGLSSDRTESKYFRKIDLKLKLDDFSTPITKIEFLPSILAYKTLKDLNKMIKKLRKLYLMFKFGKGLWK